jgi:hypothetical protein
MTSKEFRELQHGDKIRREDGTNFIVHNNHRSGPGMVVGVRTEVIQSRDCKDWNLVRRPKVNFVGVPGTYEVNIIRKVD